MLYSPIYRTLEYFWSQTQNSLDIAAQEILRHDVAMKLQALEGHTLF